MKSLMKAAGSCYSSIVSELACEHLDLLTLESADSLAIHDLMDGLS